MTAEAPADTGTQPDGGAKERKSVVFWRVSAVLSVLVALGLHLSVARSAVAPRTPWDEIGVLQMARLLVGDEVAPMSGSGYYPGWSFLLAPLWLVTDDAATVYRGAIALVIVVGMATIVPLAMLGRRLGLSTAQAVTVAALVMCLPSRAVLADYVLSEVFLTFCLAWAVLAAWELHRRMTTTSVLLFAAAVSLVHLTHARALAVVLTAMVWVVMLAVRRWQVAAVGLPALIVGLVAVRAVAEWFSERILLSGFGKSELMSTAVSSTTPELLSAVALNQTWVQILGTFGLFVIGGMVVVIGAWRELTARRPGPLTFVLGLTAATMIVSVLWWSGPRFLLTDEQFPRFDVWVYSRYIDPVAAIVVVVALAAIVRGLSRSIVLAAAGVSVLVCVPVVLWVAPDVPTWGNTAGPGNSAAILQWARFWPDQPFDRPLTPSLMNENRFWLLASVFIVASLLAIGLLRRVPEVIVAGALVVFALATYAADPDQSRDVPFELVDAVSEVEESAGRDDLAVDVDLACRENGYTQAQALNWLGFWLSPRIVDAVDPTRGGQFSADVVVACEDWPGAAEEQAERVRGESDYGYRVWVRPGAIQDEARARGLLE